MHRNLKKYEFYFYFLSKTGQRQGGIIGVLERALSRASPHIWFERALTSDRETVATRYPQVYLIFRSTHHLNL